MAVSEARRRANRKWDLAHRESLSINLPIGTKESWKEYAASFDMSLTKFIQEAVEEKARRGK